MINFLIKNENFFEIEIPGRPNEVYPRMYMARVTSADRVKIYSTDLNRVLFDSISYLDFSVNGVVETDGVKAANKLNEVVYANIASVTGALPFATSTVLLQTPTGELVYMQTLSDGTTKYVNPDGTPYTGDVTLLLPYSSGGEKQLILPITDFTASGSFDYTLVKAVHGIEIINSVEMGTGVNTLSSITNYTITPTGDLIISTNSALTTEIVRITGNN